uniref:Uncharacterized protein n=1 Tax=Pithovirus LCPAC202 TaxID=2506592 RepID=A0A481Z6R9_9VIRU|nr:MAG: uncharacterized protein LCPAC202_02800 [Pithovirus LCPAC202]
MDAKPNNVTLVTFYFDLISREENRGGVGKKYTTLGNNILDLDVNLFIIADPEVAVDAWKKRNKRNLLGKTFIFPIELENLPYYCHRPAIEKAFAAGRRPIGLSIKKDTPLYFLLGWSKFWALEQAIKLNPFRSNIFAWIDYGLFHLWPGQEIKMKKILLDNLSQLDLDKIKVTIMNDTTKDEIKNRVLYYSRRRCKMVSGYFGSGKNPINWFRKAFDQELKICLETGYPNLEESIMSAVYANNKDKFISYRGDYTDLISYHTQNINLNKVINLYQIINEMRKFRRLKMWDKTIDIYYRIIEYTDSKPPSMFIYEKLALYDEALIGGWYAKKKDLSLEAANKLIELINSNPRIHDSISWDHYNMNLGYHGLKVTKPDC